MGVRLYALRQKEQLQAIAGTKGASALVRELINKHLSKEQHEKV